MIRTTGEPGCPATKHGTGWAVKNYGCRCADARRARHGRPCRRVNSRRKLGVNVLPDPIPDHAAIELALHHPGQLHTLGSGDIGEIVLRLSREGDTAREIAERIGVASRTVTRWRTRLRAAGRLPERVTA